MIIIIIIIIIIRIIIKSVRHMNEGYKLAQLS